MYELMCMYEERDELGRAASYYQNRLCVIALRASSFMHRRVFAPYFECRIRNIAAEGRVIRHRMAGRK